MTPTEVKQLWQVWQAAHPREAARIRHRFAMQAVVDGFRQAEHYLITTIRERLRISEQEIEHALQ
jgi:hypothetical protein